MIHQNAGADADAHAGSDTHADADAGWSAENAEIPIHTHERLVEIQQITRALASPNTLRRDLCEGAMSPGEARLVTLDNRALAFHDDLAPCVLVELFLQLQQWAAAHPFDDDQDPAQDTQEQRLMRAYHRFAALSSDADAGLMTVSCDVCEAVGYGNARCWSCVAHWRWMVPGLRREIVTALIQGPPREIGDALIQGALSATQAPLPEEPVSTITTSAPASPSDLLSALNSKLETLKVVLTDLTNQIHSIRIESTKPRGTP